MVLLVYPSPENQFREKLKSYSKRRPCNTTQNLYPDKPKYSAVREGRWQPNRNINLRAKDQSEGAMPRDSGYAQGRSAYQEELELRHNNIFQGVFLIIYLLIVEIVMRALIWDSLGTLTGIILSRLYIYLP